MFKKIFLSIIIGIISLIFFAQHDAWTHKKIVSLLQKVAKESLGGNFSCTIHSVNFFTPSLVLSDVEMKPMDNALWQWRCKRCEVSCSWLQLLFKGILDQHLVIDGYECITAAAQSSFAIESHIMAMMQQSLVPFDTELKSVVFKNGCVRIYHDESNEVMINFNSSSLRIGKQVKTTMSIGDGYIANEKNNYIEKIALDLSIISEYINNWFAIGLQIAGTCFLPHLGHQGNCYIAGSWKSDCGRFSIRNAYNSLAIDPIIVTEREVRVNGRVPLSYILQCIRNSLKDQIVHGTAQFSLKMAKDAARKIEGQVVLEDVRLNQNHVCDIGKIIVERHHCNEDWKAHLIINRRNQECKGIGYWNEATKKGELIVKNITDITTKALPYWRIKHNNLFAHVTIDNETIKGSYDITATNVVNEVQYSTHGSATYQDGVCVAQGKANDNIFDLTASLYPDFMIQHFLCKDKDNKQLISLKFDDDTEKIIGSITFPFIRSMINSIVHYDVQGEGSLDITAHKLSSSIVADIALSDASIRLPQTYNFIDGCHARCTYNTINRSIVLDNGNLSLHTGMVSCLRASAYFDENGVLSSMHVPLLVDRCLLNIKKDLFALVSGSLLFTKKSSSPACVSGNIIIDKGQLKENLFSGLIQKQLLSYTHSVFSLPDVPLFCDLCIETKSPICVDTGFLQTNAQVYLRVKKDQHDPVVSGSIMLHGGMLNFPYKPLYISKGMITFVPEQLFDPNIELIARNKIKKYDIALQVEGSLSTHHIGLDATPPLTEEQIVGLLLVGAEEHSLNSMMPALIVHNLKSLIFSNNQLSFFDKYFKPLLGTFNINLVPSFADQTGRGGLRGALEITVEDRWRAVIQKNFSLTEDTKFELEFLFSDDITFRAVRDERRDLGGEVEMRWKF